MSSEAIEKLIERYEKQIEKLIERYEKQIESLQDKIFNLEDALDKAENWANQKAWARHRAHVPQELTKDLPVPRLEIRLTEESSFQWNWFYCIVYRHTTKELFEIPMGETISHGRHRYDSFESKEKAQNSLPSRDGVHIRRDAWQLDLPAFVVAQGKTWKLEEISD